MKMLTDLRLKISTIVHGFENDANITVDHYPYSEEFSIDVDYEAQGTTFYVNRAELQYMLDLIDEEIHRIEGDDWSDVDPPDIVTPVPTWPEPMFPYPQTHGPLNPVPRISPHRCPVCGGSGRVPYGFYEVVDQYGSTSIPTPEKCRTCDGTGVLWS